MLTQAALTTESLVQMLQVNAHPSSPSLLLRRGQAEADTMSNQPPASSVTLLPTEMSLHQLHMGQQFFIKFSKLSHRKAPCPCTWLGSQLVCQDLPLWPKSGVCPCSASMSIIRRARLRSHRTMPCCLLGCYVHQHTSFLFPKLLSSAGM